VNSLRSVERAVRSEVERQAGILDAGGRIIQETRHFHEESGTTRAGRSKEEAQDYRYFPEPDLVPVAPAPEWVEKLRESLPELPAARRVRVWKQISWNVLPADQPDPSQAAARELVADKLAADKVAILNAGALDLIAETIAAGAPFDQARNWWLEDLSRRANEAGVELSALDVTPAQVARISELVTAGALNNKLARQVLDGVLAGEGAPDEIVAARGLAVVTDPGVLAAAVDAAIAGNPDITAKIRDGKTAAAGALVGAVMRATGGRADAASVRELILQRCAPG
jgi:aspartyl-tRNA(Asn)/glutamyl-tRNA(Gln) amidotransferase subunit B